MGKSMVSETHINRFHECPYKPIKANSRQLVFTRTILFRQIKRPTYSNVMPKPNVWLNILVIASWVVLWILIQIPKLSTIISMITFAFEHSPPLLMAMSFICLTDLKLFWTHWALSTAMNSEESSTLLLVHLFWVGDLWREPNTQGHQATFWKAQGRCTSM